MRVSLTVFLLRSAIATLEHAREACNLGDFEEFPIRDNVALNARCFVHSTPSAAPKWLPFYGSLFAIDPERVRSRSAALVILLRTSNRTFAVTAGQGHHRVPRKVVEPDFGLRATLNAVGPDTLRSLQSRTVDPLTVQRLVVANRDTSLQTFDLDEYRELLAKLEGRPSDDELGLSIAGSDSVRLQTEIEAPGLPETCNTLLRLSRRRGYRRHFPFIDRVRPEQDTHTVSRLDAMLRDRLHLGDPTNLALALPTIERYGEVADYVAKVGHNELGDLEDLSTERLFECIARAPDTADVLQGLRVIARDSDGNAIQQGPLSDWIVAELPYRQAVFVRTSGRWYRVDSDYVAEVNRQIGEVDLIASRQYLPTIRRVHGGLEAEGEYNARCQTARRVCLDQRNILLERYGSVEPCDLFTTSRHLIHVKKLSSSGTLSHLWGQGLVSAQLLRESREFRVGLRERLGALRQLVPLEALSPSDYTVVYAIATEHDPFPLRLPFFSKVNLLHHQRQLTRMGFKVKLFRIRYR